MSISPIIDKLISADAVRIDENKQPIFTFQFQNYLAIRGGLSRQELNYVEGWRQMLGGFHSSLQELTEEEISTIVRLLEFQVEAARSQSIIS